MASKHESDLWLVDFNAKKIQLVSFDQSNNNGSIDVKIDGSVVEEKSSFKMLGLTFSSNWVGVLTLGFYSNWIGVLLYC